MADTRVEDEAAAAALDGTEIMYCVQAGGPKRVTIDLINARGANPPTNDGRALGTLSLQWSDQFLASGAVINFGGGDVLITHSANTLTFSGASNGYVFDASVAPATNDGAALGSTALKWSDGFFADGAILNFNSGNYTITHSTGLLTFSGRGDFTDLKGTITNNDAAAGDIGEIKSSTIATGSAVSLTTNTWVNVTSISLEAGDWDISGEIVLNLGATTVISFGYSSIATSSANGSSEPSATVPVGVQDTYVASFTPNSNAKVTSIIPRTRISLSGTTTVYLERFLNFSTSTAAAYGCITARRVR